MNKQTLDSYLSAYRMLHAPGNMTWKQHLYNEKFQYDNIIDCSKEERKRFSNRLSESILTITDNIKLATGHKSTLKDVVNIIVDKKNKDINKLNRKVIYSSFNGERPVGKKAYNTWCGLQVIDMDIKDHEKAETIKRELFERLKKYNWFFGIAFSSSGKGLHVYTKIQVSDIEDNRKLLFHTNFRHKFSFVYLACLKIIENSDITKDELLKWMDLHMAVPQQGAFIGYDAKPLINSNFFEDFLYINFDNVEDLGHPNIDWVTHPDLKEIFKRWDFFTEDDKEVTDDNIQVIEVNDNDQIINKTHYKHNERWRLANTLVKLYGQEQGYKYLRQICSNNVKDKELQGDCITANRHKKPIDTWAINRLNNYHGFKIKINIKQEETKNNEDAFDIVNKIDDPLLIRESPYVKTFNINSTQYLSDIKDELMDSLGRITLIEAGAGVGKTEMVKSFARDDKKIILVMPFTSTIKSKVERVEGWYYAYGNRKVRFDVSDNIAMTIDKFSKLNLMELKELGFDYIFIDESHLLFQSEYRPVMSKIVQMIVQSEIPIILMSGTPIGETIFFPNIIHLKVNKEDKRIKEFNINLANTPNDAFLYMCKNMAKDISEGKRILFPTNKGTLYKERVKITVQYFLEKEYFKFDDIIVNYYKKSNLGEVFMDDININKTIKNTNILLCSNYLSVGVDILDKYIFSIYLCDTWMPQEIEQFANRLRANDLFINIYLSKFDSEGNAKNIYNYTPLNLRLNEEEIKNCHSILRLCNSMIERNPTEYKYNSLITSIINDNKYVEFNELENKYYLNETTYKVVFFERKYREYVQQLPVLVRGMKSYGYKYNSYDHQDFVMSDEDETNLVKLTKHTRDENIKQITTYIEELMDKITPDRLDIYKGVLKGEYDIKKGSKWDENLLDRRMTVKSIEVFEKVIPIFVSFSKMYDVDNIKSIFEFCRNKNNSFNFAAIRRLRVLCNIIYNEKRKRLDLPIIEFIDAVDKFIDYTKGECKQTDIKQFIGEFVEKFTKKESTDEIKIWLSRITVESLQDKFENILKCLCEISRPKKNGMVKISRFNMLWEEKEEFNINKILTMYDFIDDIEVEEVSL